MKQLETQATVIHRRLIEDSPKLFKPPVQPAFSWEMIPLDEADVDWEDRSYHKILVCKNHPRTRYSSKNPFDRSVFMLAGVSGAEPFFDEDCNCRGSLMYFKKDGR